MMFNLGWLSKYRNELFGLSIISVIVFHYCEDLMAVVAFDTLANMGSLKNYLALLYGRVIGSIGVEIFVFLSGMGLYYSFSKDSNIKNFYIKRYKRILIPYLIVAIAFWGIKDLLILEKGIMRFLADVSFLTFFTDGVKTIWFILLMIGLYLIFPIIYHGIYSEKLKGYGLVVMITVSYLFPVALSVVSPELFRNIEIAITRIPLFVLGCGIGSYVKQGKQFTIPQTVLLIVSSLGLGAVGIRFEMSKWMERYLDGFFALGIIVLMTLLVHVCRNWQSFRKVLVWVGGLSLELYMTHTLIRNLLKTCGVATYRISFYMIVIVGGIVASIILNSICKVIYKKLDGKK